MLNLPEFTLNDMTILAATSDVGPFLTDISIYLTEVDLTATQLYNLTLDQSIYLLLEINIVNFAFIWSILIDLYTETTKAGKQTDNTVDVCSQGWSWRNFGNQTAFAI